MLPKLTALPWARIINLGSVGSTSPNARMPGYYAAKGALANMTIGLAKEVAGGNIRVNLVSPGMIHTPEVEQSYMQMAAKRGWGDTWEEVEAHVAKDIPIRRISRRAEVAALIAYLCGRWPTRSMGRISASMVASWALWIDGNNFHSNLSLRLAGIVVISAALFVIDLNVNDAVNKLWLPLLLAAGAYL